MRATAMPPEHPHAPTIADPAAALRAARRLLDAGAPAGELVAASRQVLAADAGLARRLAEAALRAAPEDAAAMHALAEALVRTGRPGRAWELFREALARDGRLAELGAPDEAAEATPWIGRFEEVACPACGERAGTPVWAGNVSARHRCRGLIDPVRLWVRCAGCGLVRVSAPPPPHVLDAWLRAEEEAATDAPPTPEELAAALRRCDRVIERIRDEGYGTAWVRRGDRAPRLFDAGDDWGVFLAAASWRGFDASGVQLRRRAARWARDRLGVRAEAGSLPADLPPGPLDVVTLWEVLDRSPDPGGLLAAVAERVEEGGLLALSTPTLDHPAHRAQGVDDPLWSRPERRTWYDRETLAVALIDAGFQPVGAWHARAPAGSTVVLARRLPDRG